VKQRLALILLALVVFAGSPVSAASNRKGDIQSGNSTCGGVDLGLPDIGDVIYHRNGGRVSINVHVKHGVPGARYGFALYHGFCTFEGDAGVLATANKRGVANIEAKFHLSAGANADTTFFGNVYQLGVQNNVSLAVTLKP
jgi:hypothetical protein